MSNESITAVSSAVLFFGCVVGLLVLGFVVLVSWQIFSKAGYSGALSLLMLIPVANIVAICILAFGRWPIHEELERLRAYMGQGQGNPMAPGARPGPFSQPGFPPQS
uniref:Uncharacterized protein n=1 Tax=Thermogemmatispora argillosa TaxID=2045280 RepID=A0A455T348_9CHLR|nr:hypothetical protein KTA_31560 [Thermogemmatispora argillosa]